MCADVEERLWWVCVCVCKRVRGRRLFRWADGRTGQAGAATSWRGGIELQRGSTGLLDGAGGWETHTVDPRASHLDIGWRRRGPWLGGSPVQAVPKLRWHRHPSSGRACSDPKFGTGTLSAPDLPVSAALFTGLYIRADRVHRYECIASERIPKISIAAHSGACCRHVDRRPSLISLHAGPPKPAWRCPQPPHTLYLRSHCTRLTAADTYPPSPSSSTRPGVCTRLCRPVCCSPAVRSSCPPNCSCVSRCRGANSHRTPDPRPAHRFFYSASSHRPRHRDACCRPSA